MSNEKSEAVKDEQQITEVLLENDNAQDATAGTEQQTNECEELASLAEQLQAAQAKQQENYDLYLRALADRENFKKRSEKEREEYISFANIGFVKKLLPIIDNLDRALISAAEHGDDFDSLHKGLEMVSKSLDDLLVAEGVEKIECLGQPFDPRYHQPLMVEANPDYPENTVIEELEKGYTLKNRVIRASLVKVSN